MPYNILLLPLIGGYYFLSNFVLFKYKYQRVSSQRLILNSALAGVFIGIVSFGPRLLFQTFFPDTFYTVSSQLSGLFKDSQRYLWTMMFGLFATIVFTHLFNWSIGKIPKLKGVPIRKAIRHYGDELEQLCLDSIVQGFALQVTLKNDKVYIGFIDEAPIPSKTI